MVVGQRGGVPWRESLNGLLARVSQWLATASAWDDRIVAVTHAAVIRAAIVTILDVRPGAFWRTDVAPLCRVWLRAQTGRWTLLSLAR